MPKANKEEGEKRKTKRKETSISSRPGKLVSGIKGKWLNLFFSFLLFFLFTFFTLQIMPNPSNYGTG